MASPAPSVIGIVVAAGEAVRFGGPVPKQYLDLAGRSVLLRSVEALASRPRVAGVVVVVAPYEIGGPRAAEAQRAAGVCAVVPGGSTRADSVRRGLEAAEQARWVLVHDAARPLVSPRLVDTVLEATILHGAAAPALPAADTVKVDDGTGFVARTLDRRPLRLAQTPQGARRDWLAAALERAAAEGREVTDEAQALEEDGRRVALVQGDPGNRKITTPGDLEEARRLLEQGPDWPRVGTGFDVHRFAKDRPLVLGGVSFPGERGLAGHSDADVILHAAMDAVLGAAGLEDIGHHFPPGDPRFAGARSLDLAARVRSLLRRGGWEIVNLDLTLLAERPRIRDRVDEMRAAVGGALGIGPDRVGIKATTLEGLGALGRGEGIACQAVALVRRYRP